MANNYEEGESKKVTLRNYQVELFEKAKEQNCILFLPTGSGKTCIALWLIKHMSADLKREENRKWTFFLVNTVELVSQQSEYIRSMCPLKVIGISSELGVDAWEKSEWEYLRRNYEVFVMTSQIYLDALKCAFMSIFEANLLIFDECYSAVKGHPMKKILERYDRIPESDRPRILGLSATLLNANTKGSQVHRVLQELEQTLRAKIITSKYSEEIKMYSTKPQELVEHFSRYDLPINLTEHITTLCHYGITLVTMTKLKDDDIVEQIRARMTSENRINWNPQDILLNAPGVGRSKLLRNALKDIMVHLELFGLYVAFDCCRCYSVQMYRFMHESRDDDAYVMLIMFVMNIIQIIWKILRIEIIKYGPLLEVSTILKTSTRKLTCLFNRIRDMKATDKCIVFVERKVTARVLYRLIKIFLEANSETSHLTVDFIMGSDCNPLRNTKESIYDKRVRKNILKRFRGKGLNIMVATNILEEGIDVQNCNFVFMFDGVKTFRSYVQSKGRARQETSKFIILNDGPEENIECQLQKFRILENELKQVVKDKDIHDDFINDGILSQIYTTCLNANIREDESVSLVHRYCATLPHDKYTKLTPFLWKEHQSDCKGVICKLSLPINSAWRDLIRSEPCSSEKAAIQNVCFKAIKILHKEKALDDHLNPIRTLAQLPSSSEEWIPNKKVEKEDDGYYMANIKMPSFLKGSRPIKDEPCYMHVIHIKTEYELPEIKRQLFCHCLLSNNQTFFGIVTRNRLPAICSFPIYSDLGKVMVRIECNARKITLSKKELSDISKFHRFLFLNVLKVVKSCFTYDLSAEDYFIVPLIGEPGDYKIFQKLIQENMDTNVVRPSVDDIRSEKYDLDSYIGKIIAPHYRDRENPHYYLVTETNTDIFLHTTMENSKKTFEEYFKEKYDLTASRPVLPLFEVRKLPNAIECIIPRPVPSSVKQRKRAKRDIQTYLPPEFCCKFDFPAVFWYKSLLLPSILHRIHDLLLAEELRRKIVENTGVGKLDIGEECLKSDEYFKCVTLKPSNSANIKDEIKNTNAVNVTKKTVQIRQRGSSVKEKNVNEQTRPKDIYRCLDNVTLEDVQNFTDYFNETLYTRNTSTDVGIRLMSVSSNVGRNEIENIDFVDPPTLVTLKRYSNAVGPNQYHLLQAITLKGAGDLFHMERAETLGDSFLKYAVSLTIFLKEPKMNEGLLTSMKCLIVGNKNLCNCGLKLGISEYIKAQKFIVDKRWYPPGFGVPEYPKNNFPISRAVVLKIKIPYHEQFSGYISEETIDNLTTTLKTYVKETDTSDINNANDEKVGLFYCEKQKLAPKSISDVVEALIGVYLEKCGIDGASAILKYFNVLNANHLEEAISKRIKPPEPEVPFKDFTALCASYKNIEDIFHYEFKNKGYILQAITHPSFKFNLFTDCYQKLEFLGDAVLDFLITSHIYEHCDNLSPGELTDLRSSLVNNTTFGALSVRLGLHKHLLANSPTLNGAIKLFVDYQIGMNYEIHGNELMKLVNEDDTLIAEEVDVPKSLGDIFESFAGAIFLDSGYDLNVVWRIYFNLMKEEINKFSTKIPLNPVRALYEKCSKFKFVLPENTNEKKKEVDVSKMKIALRVYSNDENFTFYGIGVNTSAAKRAAAKLALKKLGFNDFVI